MQLSYGYSDDYAILESGKYTFYYGYEETDENENWLFIIRQNGNVIFQKTSKEIENSLNDNYQLHYPVDYLNVGIGLWLLIK